MAIEYEDFSIRLTALGEGRFQAQVVERPVGKGEERPHLDGPVELGPLPRDLLTGPPETVGHALYSFLFKGLVRNLFERSLGLTQTAQRGLRLILRFDSSAPENVQLTRLPWELLYKRETEQFLALDPRTPVVRRPDELRPIGLPPLAETLRILVVDTEGAEIRERERLAQICEGLPIEVHHLGSATRADLVRRPARERGHVLHLLDSGGALREADLAAIVRSSPALRLVFLGVRRSDREPALFAGVAEVAEALLRHGAPAVLAVQPPMTADDTMRFAQAVYRSLTLGSTLEEAVSAGRGTLSAHAHDRGVAATPVLYSRTRVRGTNGLPPLGTSALWTILGLSALSLTFNVWSRSQGWDIFLPGFEFAGIDNYAVPVYGILLGAPLLALLFQVTRWYQRARSGPTFADRLPMAFGIYPSLLGPSWRSHQAAFFFLFLIFPTAGQVHFYCKMSGGPVYDQDQQQDRADRAATARYERALERYRQVRQNRGVEWRGTDQSDNVTLEVFRQIPSQSGHPWESKPRALQGHYRLGPPDTGTDTGIRFIPFWEPLLLFLAQTPLWFYFARVCAGVFGWDKGRRRRRSAVRPPG